MTVVKVICWKNKIKKNGLENEVIPWRGKISLI